MIPLLHHNLKQNTTTDIPPEFQKALSNLIRIHTNQVLKMNFELLRVVKILKQHNIRLIPYKELVLSLMAYGDSNFCSFDDLDILVSEDDYFKRFPLMSLPEAPNPQSWGLRNRLLPQNWGPGDLR